MSKGTVLVVEDQAPFREFLEVTLSKLGFDVVTALTGKIALDQAQKHKPDLVFLDVMLPDMDGYQICNALRDEADLSMTPIIFISALGTQKHIDKAMAAGATDYLVKPLGMDDIKDIVSQYIGG
jgi:DNA-binding response OmpR family regulator